METCQACASKGPAWPGHLDFSTLSPGQVCCPWCNGSKQITAEVASVFRRLSSDPTLLSVRANSLAARALEAETAANELKRKKRPRGFHETKWEQMVATAVKNAAQAKQDAIEARSLAQKMKENPQ